MPLHLRSCVMGWSEYQKESEEYAWNAPAEEPEELRCSRSRKATPRARHASARTAKKIDPVPVDLERRPLSPHAAYRRNELQAIYVKFEKRSKN